MIDTAALLDRCTFPPAGRPIVCGLSGGADSAALVVLAAAAGCVVEAVHVHHGIRPAADDDAEIAGAIAAGVGAAFRVVHVQVPPGPNLEARARDARRHALGASAATGHTADDQAETVLLALLRGSGPRGLSGMQRGRRHPILALRRAETRALCVERGIVVAEDPSNDDLRFRRNRIRHELLPLLDTIADRDVVPLLTRSADLLRRDEQLLDELAGGIDPTDTSQISSAPTPLATRALRDWLTVDGHPPDAASIERVLAVARGSSPACEISGGRRIQRVRDRLRLCPTVSPSD